MTHCFDSLSVGKRKSSRKAKLHRRVKRLFLQIITMSIIKLRDAAAVPSVVTQQLGASSFRLHREFHCISKKVASEPRHRRLHRLHIYFSSFLSSYPFGVARLSYRLQVLLFLSQHVPADLCASFPLLGAITVWPHEQSLCSINYSVLAFGAFNTR